MVWAGPERSPCTFQAEVWDLDMLRSNHSTWPVRVSQIKQGFIVVKGHSTVSLPLTAPRPRHSSPFPHAPHLIPEPPAVQVALPALCPRNSEHKVSLSYRVYI